MFEGRELIIELTYSFDVSADVAFKSFSLLPEGVVFGLEELQFFGEGVLKGYRLRGLSHD